MLTRQLQSEVTTMANAYPVVTIIGPRQSGKTTLVRHIFPDKPYVNLESPEERILAESDPNAFLRRYPNGVILDEIQRVPSLLSYVQVIVDENKQRGQFILTGSHQLALHEAIGQSLAGRTAILKLWPFSLRELQLNGIQQSLEKNLLCGGFANLHLEKIEPYKFYSHYCQTYLERDVRLLINIKDLVNFQRFMKLCAARISCTINANDLANELGVSSPTIAQWLSILEASFLIFRLPPYFENFGKRLIKSPKLYFTDVGLASYLLGIETDVQMDRDPLRGKLFENLVILELMKARIHDGRDPQLYFYRDKNQLEVDVLFQQGAQLIPIEIKSSRTFNNNFLQGLEKFHILAEKRAMGGYLIYAGDQEQSIRQYQLLNYLHTAQIVE